MTKFDQIKSSIETLSAPEIARLREWLDDVHERLFDERLEQDARTGKLDKLAAPARANLESGIGHRWDDFFAHSTPPGRSAIAGVVAMCPNLC